MNAKNFNYESPIVEVIAIEVEKGFAGSEINTGNIDGWTQGEEW